MSLEKEAAYGLPQQSMRFLANSSSWNVNGNLRTVKQMLRILSQLASDNVIAQPSVYFRFG